MSLSIKLTGTLNIQLTDEAQPFPVPVNYAMQYSEKVLYDFLNNGTVTHVAVPQGSVTNPSLIIVWVREGSIDLSWDPGGANPTTITANPVPTTVNTPLMILSGYMPAARQLYLTSTGVARGAIWLFE